MKLRILVGLLLTVCVLALAWLPASPLESGQRENVRTELRHALNYAEWCGGRVSIERDPGNHIGIYVTECDQ